MGIKTLRDAENMLCQYVTNNLPEGWSIVLTMAADECSLDLLNEEAEDVPFYESGVHGAVQEAIDIENEKAGEA